MQFLLNLVAYFRVVVIFSIAFFVPYRAFRSFDLSVGIIFLAGGYSFTTLAQAGHVVAGMIVGAVVGAAISTGVLALLTRPLAKREASPLGLTLCALGSYIVGLNLVSLIFGNEVQRPTGLSISAPVRIGDGVLSGAQIGLVAVAVLGLAALCLVLRQSRTGRYFRALSDSAELARALGLPADSTIFLLTATTAALVGLSGALIAADIGIQPTSAFLYIIPALAAVLAFGGRTILQAAFGAATIAFTGESAGYFFGQQWRELVIFTLVALFLAVRRFRLSIRT